MGQCIYGRLAYSQGWIRSVSGLGEAAEEFDRSLPQQGDRFYPVGAPGERKLSDVLTDKKIAKEKRDLPLLCADNEVYYACGLTISEHAKVTPDTREILHIICNRGTRD
ncbi:MAG: tRNA lysidine(34) synthetase TilS [Eubacteriales bacterium]